MLVRLIERAKPVLMALGVYRPARFVYRRVANRRGLREMKEQMAFYADFVSAGDLCFDIGANRGVKSEALLRVGARVVAVEPQPACAVELRERLGHFQDFVCVESAVGERPGTATLNVSECDVLSSVDPNWFGQSGQWSASIPVKMTTLDGLIAEYGAPRYCKIDVEGFELAVLRGLSQRVPHLSFEFHIGADLNAATLACLARLEHFGPYQASLSRQEAPRLVEPWMSAREFAAYFEDRIARDESFDYGEIYVRYPS
jgi:FkbM family methyltransferase